MNISQLSSKYRVRKMETVDVEAIYELYLGNPMFFYFCPPQPTREGIREDIKALPPQVSPDQKYYVGFFSGDQLVAVMDLILGYPDRTTAFIGLFMMSERQQGKGAGSGIIAQCAEFLKRQGYRKIRLAYVKGNPQSERFWGKNGFEPIGKETDCDGYTAVLMEKPL